MKFTAGVVELFFSIIPLILFFANFNMPNKTRGLVLQRALLLFAFITLVVDAVTNLVFGNPSLIVLHKIAYCVDYPLVCVCLYLFFAFTIENVNETLPSGKLFEIISAVLLGVSSLIWMIAPLINVYYSFLPSGEIEYYYPSFWISQCIAALVLIATLVFVLRYRRELGKRRTASFLVYGLLPLIAFPIEMIVDLPFMYCAIAVSLLILHITVNENMKLSYVEREKELAERKLQIAESENKIRVSQIQPHFLYNVLATIGYLCKKEPKLASTAIDNFSDYLRMNLSAISVNGLVPFTQELKHTEKYLWLEKLRFEDRLKIIYDTTATDFMLPALTVQPLVENAVKHGICEKPEGGTLILRSVEYEDEYHVVIEDDGVGFDVESVYSDGKLHIGIENVKKRLSATCNATLEIKSAVGKGTVAIIRIPKTKED